MVTRRRRELVELAARFSRLPPDERGPIGRVALAYAGAPVVLEIAGLVVGVRTARRLWRTRGHFDAQVALVRRSPLLPLVLAHLGYRWVARVLLIRWLRRRVPSATA